MICRSRFTRTQLFCIARLIGRHWSTAGRLLRFIGHLIHIQYIRYLSANLPQLTTRSSILIVISCVLENMNYGMLWERELEWYYNTRSLSLWRILRVVVITICTLEVLESVLEINEVKKMSWLKGEINEKIIVNPFKKNSLKWQWRNLDFLRRYINLFIKTNK